MAPNGIKKLHSTLITNPSPSPICSYNVTTFTYEVGDLIKVKDLLNRETQRILDAAGRLRNITYPLGQKTLDTPDALDHTYKWVRFYNHTIEPMARPPRIKFSMGCCAVPRRDE